MALAAALLSWISLAPTIAQSIVTGAPSGNSGAVVINEILAHTDDPLNDTIELFNSGAQSVDISHWCLTDKSDALCLLALPAGSVISPYGFHVITLDDASPFRLSEFGETLTLSAATAGGVLTGYVDAVKFGATPNGISVGRTLTSDGAAHFPLMQHLTLGAANPAPLVSPIVIDEIMYRPAAGKPQFIAVRNYSSAPQPFYHPEEPGSPWEVDGIGAVALPADIVLAPGERLFVTQAAPDALRAAYGLASTAKVYGPWAGALQTNGENIELKRPGKQDEDETEPPMITVDAVDFTPVAPWPIVGEGNGLAIRRLSAGALGSEPLNWTTGEVARTFLPAARQ